MAWAIFKVECNWARPRSKFSFNAKASAEPQERPQDFIDYCVRNGWAEQVPSPTSDEKRALKGRSRAK